MDGAPSHHFGFSIFITIAPAVAVLVLLKLAKRSLIAWRIVELYLMPFVIMLAIQQGGRKIPVYRIVQSFKARENVRL